MPDSRIFLLVFAPGEAWDMFVSGLHAMWDGTLPWIVGGIVVVSAVLVATLLVKSVKALSKQPVADARMSPPRPRSNEEVLRGRNVAHSPRPDRQPSPLQRLSSRR
jgi:hypothetical protein